MKLSIYRTGYVIHLYVSQIHYPFNCIRYLLNNCVKNISVASSLQKKKNARFYFVPYHLMIEVILCAPVYVPQSIHVIDKKKLLYFKRQ